MTIVLQHQYWDLAVTEHAFEVGLSFNGIPERLLVPFTAVKGFADPSVQFGLQFEIGGRAASRRRRAGPAGRREARPASPVVPSRSPRKRAPPKREPRGRQPRRLPEEVTTPPARAGPSARRRTCRETMTPIRRCRATKKPHPHRDRHVRPDRGPRRPLLGRAGGAFAGEFPDRLGEAAGADRPRPRPRQARRRRGQHGPRQARPDRSARRSSRRRRR